MAGKLIEIQILVNVFMENDYYIAYSPDLQIATQGKTEAEVEKRFAERLDIFFNRQQKHQNNQKAIR